MKKIFFITGASGVGKTTLVKGLQSELPISEGLVFLHFDSIDIPSLEDMEKDFGSGENWQREMTYKWIGDMISGYQDADTIIFEGQVNPEFIQEGFKKYGFTNYEIILLDSNQEIMFYRLRELRDQPDLANQDMINWLEFLRNKAIDLNIKIINTSNITEKELINIGKSLIK